MTDTELHFMQDLMRRMAAGQLSADQVAQLESVMRSMLSKGTVAPPALAAADSRDAWSVTGVLPSPARQDAANSSGHTGYAPLPPTAFPSRPQFIGPFTIVGVLGHSGLAHVYLGRSANGELAAVKSLHIDRLWDPEFRTRFRREINAARRVGSDFTAQLIEADPDADPPWLATAYIPAPSLTRLVMACGPLPPAAVAWLAAGCARALDSIHRAGIVHRDLKPSNVLVTLDGVRVIDFGIARVTGNPELTGVGMTLGTPGYMAPEQVNGSPATPASDMFALGATLLFAASGHAAYPGDTRWVAQLLTGDPDLSGIAAEVTPLITACMQREPQDRPTVGELLSQVEGFALPPGDHRSQIHPYLPESAVSLIREYSHSSNGASHTFAPRTTGTNLFPSAADAAVPASGPRATRAHSITANEPLEPPSWPPPAFTPPPQPGAAGAKKWRWWRRRTGDR
jgi:serine/threonine protein kinase